MPKFLFTNDQRISVLKERIKWVADFVTKGGDTGKIPNKSDQNNATTLIFYYNLYPHSKVCSDAIKNPIVAIRNFILKFQFPNTRTAESLKDSMDEHILFAPFRSVIKVLHEISLKDKINSFLTLDEILFYFFINKDVYRNPRFDSGKLIGQILEGRRLNRVYAKRISSALQWKDYKRQVRELYSVLKYAFASITLKGGNVILNVNSPSYKEDLIFIEEILNYNRFWVPSDQNNYTLSCQEFTNYMDTSNIPFNIVDLELSSDIKTDTPDEIELNKLTPKEVEELYFNFVIAANNKRTATNYRWALRKEDVNQIIEDKLGVKSIFELFDVDKVNDIYSYFLPTKLNKDSKGTISAALLKYMSFLEKYLCSSDSKELVPLQKIYFGTPGGGKSNKVKCFVEDVKGARERSFRTTFHPDTDYSSFVGSYKPVMVKNSIEYRFIPQVFTEAYVAAWNNESEDYYIIIEEINRGNCAQIFGDLFQLLDRDKNTGYSEYPIVADLDLCHYLQGKRMVNDEEVDVLVGKGKNGIKNGKLCLPPNLSILATMNTSDQSLFPMDSAFKRRWDWEYVPSTINEEDNFDIIIDDKIYKWHTFRDKVNEQIFNTTDSEDKLLGSYFIKDNIDAEQFKSKIMFYLWSEICKEEFKTKRNFFRSTTVTDDKTVEEEFSFNMLYNENGLKLLQGFMKYLGVDGVTKPKAISTDLFSQEP